MSNCVFFRDTYGFGYYIKPKLIQKVTPIGNHHSILRMKDGDHIVVNSPPKITIIKIALAVRKLTPLNP